MFDETEVPFERSSIALNAETVELSPQLRSLWEM
jgi:hypothetical protein